MEKRHRYTMLVPRKRKDTYGEPWYLVMEYVHQALVDAECTRFYSLDTPRHVLFVMDAPTDDNPLIRLREVAAKVAEFTGYDIPITRQAIDFEVAKAP